jgi:hypothetical protein
VCIGHYHPTSYTPLPWMEADVGGPLTAVVSRCPRQDTPAPRSSSAASREQPSRGHWRPVVHLSIAGSSPLRSRYGEPSGALPRSCFHGDNTLAPWYEVLETLWRFAACPGGKAAETTQILLSSIVLVSN